METNFGYKLSTKLLQQYRRLSRKELLVKFQHIGSFLTPLIRKAGKELLAAFDPLPYTELPSVSSYPYPAGFTSFPMQDKDYNHEFLMASQILNKIRVDSQNLAGCLFYSHG